MVLLTSKAAFLLERSMLFRWIRFLLIPLGILVGVVFLQSDIQLNLVVKLIVFHAVVLAIFFVFTRLSDWLSGLSDRNVQIACFDQGKLSLNLDVQAEYDATSIQRIEFVIPSVFKTWNWPYAKNTITLYGNDGVKQLKTSFELMSLQSFLCNVNRSLNESNQSFLNKAENV
ncbi:hypothetical protein Q3O60_08595 [Alkalimonas collagenimarina]|uniref:Uncharacterized protein n=1 Tax=Alkalimonas collagenimarina TaxID=400390 RepID=A0ABT9GZF4_9GAMM|nr:hypothetical protein [Alkalimonas collagenimarina]MDP4536244.1 hypothetical protein [Alkalimonas collagenimarina]